MCFQKDAQITEHINIGQLRSHGRIQVVSGTTDRTVVHFEAPEPILLDKEISNFLTWFNNSKTDTLLDPLLRAATTHLWFNSLHPFEDDNGRIARFLTDLALAQADQQSIKFFAMPVRIFAHRASYYETLEMAKKGDIDTTSWLRCFFHTLDKTLVEASKELNETTFKASFLRDVNQTRLSAQQLILLR